MFISSTKQIYNFKSIAFNLYLLYRGTIDVPTMRGFSMYERRKIRIFIQIRRLIK